MDKNIYVKNRHLFKSKWGMIIYTLVFCLLIGLFIYIGTIDFSSDLEDNEIFASDFSLVDTNNVFCYVNATKIRSIISSSSGIILFGTTNEWVNYYVSMVNDVALEVGIDTIYYYDFIDNRDDNNATYEDIVSKLSNYVTYDDTGSANIYAPTLVVVKNGEVIYYDNETSFIDGEVTPEVYWTDLNKGLKEEEIKEVFLEYLES